MVSIQIENVDNEVGEGSQHGDDGEGDGLGTGDGRGIALVLVGRDVHDVVLFEIVVGGVDDVLVLEVESCCGLVALGILAHDEYIVSFAVDGHVAGIGECLEDGDMVVGNGEVARVFHFAENGDLEVGASDGDDGFLGEDTGIESGLDEILELGTLQSLGVDLAQDWEVDVAFFVYLVGLESSLSTGRVGISTREERRRGLEVEWCGGFGSGCADGDGQFIIEGQFGFGDRVAGLKRFVLRILKVGYFLVRGAGCQRKTQKAEKDFYKRNLVDQYHDFVVSEYTICNITKKKGFGKNVCRRT